jgi:hypothetical protein
MTNTSNEYLTKGDNSIYAGADGKVVPVVTRAGQEDTNAAQSGDRVRVSGVSVQHTPATKIWFGQVSNVPGYRSLPHHHGEAETGGYVLRGRRPNTGPPGAASTCATFRVRSTST